MSYTIRWGTPADMPAVQALIHELAEYEKEPDAVDTTVESLTKDGFGDNPCFQIFVAEDDEKGVIGIALFFIGYSTWKGRMLYLDDLVVKEAMRGQGIGRALLDRLIQHSQEEEVQVVCWQVLDWNMPAIEFYKSVGTTIVDGWLNCRVYKDGIANWEMGNR
ncbi:MAG: N-acetyltransferase family protein [Bacteroidia bacterium]